MTELYLTGTFGDGIFREYPQAGLLQVDESGGMLIQRRLERYSNDVRKPKPLSDRTMTVDVRSKLAMNDTIRVKTLGPTH